MLKKRGDRKRKFLCTRQLPILHIVAKQEAHIDSSPMSRICSEAAAFLGFFTSNMCEGLPFSQHKRVLLYEPREC
jgi:hypothetical protein